MPGGVLSAIKENPVVSSLSLLSVIAVLGGSVAVTLPADEKVAALEEEFTQYAQFNEKYHTAREREWEMRELDKIDWRMGQLMREIERMEKLPEYLGRPLNSREQWRLHQAIEDWNNLKQLRKEILNQ